MYTIVESLNLNMSWLMQPSRDTCDIVWNLCDLYLSPPALSGTAGDWRFPLWAYCGMCLLLRLFSTTNPCTRPDSTWLSCCWYRVLCTLTALHTSRTWPASFMYHSQTEDSVLVSLLACGYFSCCLRRLTRLTDSLWLVMRELSVLVCVNDSFAD